MLPLYTVEKPGFINLLKQFDPQYKLPGRKYFTKTVIPQLYERTRQSVLHDIKILNFIQLQLTCVNSDPYMSYTIHYVSKEWDLRSNALGTMYFQTLLKQSWILCIHGVLTAIIRYSTDHAQRRIRSCS